MHLLEIPYCEQNEIASKRFIKRFHEFTDEKHDMGVKWLTKKLKSHFPLTDCNSHLSCKIYKGIHTAVDLRGCAKGTCIP